MADFAPNHKLGEQFVDAETTTVEYTENIIAGDLLKVTGINADNHLRVAKHTAALKARFVASYPGKNGQLHEVLRRGTTKGTFGGNVTPGATAVPKNNKLVNSGTAGSGGACGQIESDGAADNDTGYVYFDGGMS